MMEHHSNIDLPAEIFEEILLMLPVKTLSRFKCVCKQWRHLIESWGFIDRHYHHQSNQDRLFFNFSEVGVRGNLSEEALLFTYLDSFIHFMGPANGLFCEIGSRRQIIMLNPAMRQIKAVPPLPRLSWRNPFGICSQLRSLTFGFGLDPFTGDCKIVAFYRDLHHELKNFVCVYNSSRNSWKFNEHVDWVDSMMRSSFSKWKTFLNGVHYWLVPPLGDGGSLTILAFDMRTERFREIQVPRGLPRLKIDNGELDQGRRDLLALLIKMVAYGDSIALMSEESGEWVDLWVMGEEGSWTKNFRVGPIVHRYNCIMPICMWKNQVLYDTFGFGDSDLILHDVSTNNFRIFNKAPFDQHRYGRFFRRAFSYKESLVSIKGVRMRSDRLNLAIHFGWHLVLMHQKLGIQVLLHASVDLFLFPIK